MARISKIKIVNFKRFKEFVINPNPRVNILVGDNEVGKSTILQAIDIVASGSVHKIENLGLENLFNVDVVSTFLHGERKFENLPVLQIELFLEDIDDVNLNGKNNSEKITCDGIRLVCEPNEDYINEINRSMESQADYFPYEYYSIRFSTFADDAYSGYKKKLNSILIDSTNLSSTYATNEFVKRMYRQYTDEYIQERAYHRSELRMMQQQFKADTLKSLNERVTQTNPNYSFGLKIDTSVGIENALTIYEKNVVLENKGKGREVFIKTEFALEKAKQNIDVILIEEPENHLSPINLRKLLSRIIKTQNGQIFVTTHNSLISTRLELKNLIILHDNNAMAPTTLKELADDTSRYFYKAPPANVIEFSLSPKCILVEGPSEYMLMERFYETVCGHKPQEDNVHVINVRGLSFKRFLDMACLLRNRVVVITDNDGDIQTNCIKKYTSYIDKDNIKICYHNDENQRTYEYVLFENNRDLCINLFGEKAVDYMLNNKTEAAYALLEQDKSITVPQYIKEAILWIKN